MNAELDSGTRGVRFGHQTSPTSDIKNPICVFSSQSVALKALPPSGASPVVTGLSKRAAAEARSARIFGIIDDDDSLTNDIVVTGPGRPPDFHFCCALEHSQNYENVALQ